MAGDFCRALRICHAKLRVGPALSFIEPTSRRDKRAANSAGSRWQSFGVCRHVESLIGPLRPSVAWARRIGQNAAVILADALGYHGFLNLPWPHNVEHALSRRQQIVGNDPAMAAPPEALCTHDGARASARERLQAIEPTPERLARRVVGIVVKTLVLPKRIGGGRYLPLPAAATTEFSDV